MGKASRTKQEWADKPSLTGEEIEALVKKRAEDQQARVKRATERLRAIEDEERVMLISQPATLPPNPGEVGMLRVIARRVFIPREILTVTEAPALLAGPQPTPQQPT